MKTFLTVLCLALVACTWAEPAYQYQQPAKPQPGPVGKQTAFRPSPAVSSSGIYSVAQSAPLNSFSVQGSQQIKQNFAPQPIPAATQYAQQYAAPAPQYIAPNPQYSAPAPQFVGPSPQNLAPVQQQQQPQPQQQYPAPTQQQQQFVASAQSSQQYAGPVQSQYAGPVQPQYSGPAQSQYAGPVQQTHFSGSASLSQPQYQNFNSQAQQPAIISKDIYIHSAPEETEEIGNAASAPVGPARKNYRIVFIKAPSQNVKLNLDALKRAQASNEEKTVIYVLSKKPDLSEIHNQLAAVQGEQKTHKPEVYFIKYKTQEEANRAQQEIQAQYDSLGGSTHISDEGIAPITSVIGGGPINVERLGVNHGGISPAASSVQQQFVQQSFQTSHSSVGSSGSTVSFSDGPSQKYLTPKKK